jgi:hypothetical protein
MEPNDTPFEYRPVIQRVVAAGLLISILVAVLTVAIAVTLWLQARTSPTWVAVPLAVLLSYWFAARYAYFVNGRSRLEARVPAWARKAMLWLVIAMSFLLGGAVWFLFQEGLWNYFKDDQP